MPGCRSNSDGHGRVGLGHLHPQAQPLGACAWRQQADDDLEALGLDAVGQVAGAA